MKPPSTLQELAETILKDTATAFHFGSVNREPMLSTNKQFSFINQELERLLTQSSTGDYIFFRKQNIKKISLPYKKLKEIHMQYSKTHNFTLGMQLLATCHTYATLKAKFKTQYKSEWQDDWLNHLAPLFALDHLQKTQTTRQVNLDKKKKERFKYFKNISNEGIPDDARLHQFYFEYLVPEIFLTTGFGVGNCEPMADFALLNAIEKSKDLACTINYIRFSSYQDCEELNTIALGNWPDKGCLIVCPWLGEIYPWEGDLKSTLAVSHYPSYKNIICMKPGEEMNTLRTTLETIPFTTRACEKKLATQFEEQAHLYQKAFKEHIINTEQINNNTANTPTLKQ
jgi:hypothetical protein